MQDAGEKSAVFIEILILNLNVNLMCYIFSIDYHRQPLYPSYIPHLSETGTSKKIVNYLRSLFFSNTERSLHLFAFSVFMCTYVHVYMWCLYVCLHLFVGLSTGVEARHCSVIFVYWDRVSYCAQSTLICLI